MAHGQNKLFGSQLLNLLVARHVKHGEVSCVKKKERVHLFLEDLGNRSKAVNGADSVRTSLRSGLSTVFTSRFSSVCTVLGPAFSDGRLTVLRRPSGTKQQKMNFRILGKATMGDKTVESFHDSCGQWPMYGTGHASSALHGVL